MHYKQCVTSMQIALPSNNISCAFT